MTWVVRKLVVVVICWNCSLQAAQKSSIGLISWKHTSLHIPEWSRTDARRVAACLLDDSTCANTSECMHITCGCGAHTVNRASRSGVLWSGIAVLASRRRQQRVRGNMVGDGESAGHARLCHCMQSSLIRSPHRWKRYFKDTLLCCALTCSRLCHLTGVLHCIRSAVRLMLIPFHPLCSYLNS